MATGGGIVASTMVFSETVAWRGSRSIMRDDMIMSFEMSEDFGFDSISNGEPWRILTEE